MARRLENSSAGGGIHLLLSRNTEHVQSLETRTKQVLLALLVGFVLVGCASDEGDSASAGAGRTGPATDMAPLFTDSGQPDVSSDPVQTTDRRSPPDRVLREGVTGTVTVVIDGDTVHITVDGWYHTVRVQGINAPECHKSLLPSTDGDQFTCTSDDELWGLGSSDALKEYALGATVTVHCNGEPGDACPTDPFDRFLAFADGDEVGDIGLWMVRNGHALSYTKFGSTRRAVYCEAEDLARSEGLGIWTFGTREEILTQMNDETRDWYEHRDERCEEALAEGD